MRLRPWRFRTSKPALARVYLLLGAILLAVALLFYFRLLSMRIEDQAEANGRLAAELVGFSTLAMQQFSDPDIVARFTRTLQDLSFPVIITNDVGRPLAWNAQVSDTTLSQREILEEDLKRPGPVMERVLERLRAMDRQHEAVAILPPGGEPVSMFLHYGSPALVNELHVIPWITILVAAVFGFVGLLILRSIKRAEQSLIWAGLAKESAHQMGTPISSLMGWMEVLKDEVSFGDHGAAVMPRELFEEVVREVGQDADRLNRVAARFSQIGSRPRLVREAVSPMVEETVRYFRRRIPQGLDLSVETEPDLPDVEINRELIIWVLENLVKNAMNSVGEGGRVSVSVRRARDGKALAISVRDNGRGVAPGMERQIFRPGVSTRKRGWGLGLPLSRRIVEEYHKGRLDLAWTEEGKGAEFRLLLPAAGS